MGSYRLFIDGVAVGFLLALAAGYLLFRFKQSRANRPKDEIDRLIEDFQAYYRKLEEEKADPYDERGL
ncbi:MAG: hypothetical protein HYY21_07095 [Candidatus Tectomicrobia bacterium]|nr:hypothetical protein [Candidatus Tectomicrobia bacterium]